MTLKSPWSELVFGLNDKPPATITLVAGLQHLLAVFGGIVAAPLIMAMGMGLPVLETHYLLSSALLVSGVATAIQISRLGSVGSGLLSIQGTSFTFIGPVLFAYHGLPDALSPGDRLAAIFGACALAALIMMLLSSQLPRLRRVLSPAVTGTTVILIGITLVWGTLGNLLGEWQAGRAQGQSWLVPLLGIAVLGTTLLLACQPNPWLRLCSIVAGLAVGTVVALTLGLVDFSVLASLPRTSIPEPLRYGLGFDWGVFVILLPVFLVSATESVGDLTATSALSREPLTGPVYWSRIRGGILGDAFNSLLAAFFATFPNTTFSQNNGVIRLTGIASRRIGYVVAGLLVLLGLFPVVAGLVQVLPPTVLYAGTLLLFAMVALSGAGILRRDGSRRAMVIAGVAVVGGLLVSAGAQSLALLPDQVAMIIQYPVSTGAMIALLLELLLPQTAGNSAPGREVVPG
ncbi:MAG TPA: solute carrier family 23 protein [Kineobactrum sp.]